MVRGWGAWLHIWLPRAHVCTRVLGPWRSPAPPGPGSLAGAALCLRGAPLGPPAPPLPPRAPRAGSTRGAGTHFIFSARCSVSSRMAWDSRDTGFSIRLSKITCEGRHQQRAQGSPPSLPPPPGPEGPCARSRGRGGGCLPPRGSEASSCWPGGLPAGRSCSGPSPGAQGRRAAPSGSGGWPRGCAAPAVCWGGGWVSPVGGVRQTVGTAAPPHEDSRWAEWTPGPSARGPWTPRPRQRQVPDPELRGPRRPPREARPRQRARLTSSRAEMVEAGTLLREELRTGPGETRASPSPATSWISRARMATSFTSVWLSLRWAGRETGAVGASQPGAGARDQAQAPQEAAPGSPALPAGKLRPGRNRAEGKAG